MKIKLMLFLLVLTTQYMSAQIGIKIENPLGIFHIDGNGDNDPNNVSKAQGNNDFIVTTDGNVGIGTTDPNYKLSVNGTFKITNLTNITSTSIKGSSTYENLYIDRNTGEFVTVSSSSASANNTNVPINYIEYTLRNIKNVKVLSYDTKISSKDFLISIIGTQLTNAGKEMGLDVTDSNLTGKNLTFTGVKIQAYDNGKTWMLTLDYPGTSAANGITKTVQWQVNCLAISRGYVNLLSDQTFDMGGKNTASAVTYPNGL